MLRLSLVVSVLLSLSVPYAFADSPWYRLFRYQTRRSCKVLADPNGRPIQQRYETGGARIYAIGGKACPKKFPGESYATISTARSITTDGKLRAYHNQDAQIGGQPRGHGQPLSVRNQQA